MNSLAIVGGPKTIESDKARFTWPVVTPEVERVVMDQLRLNLSIYDCSGIFMGFEQRFAKYHGMQHALLSNSGTSAISPCLKVSTFSQATRLSAQLTPSTLR